MSVLGNLHLLALASSSECSRDLEITRTFYLKLNEGLAHVLGGPLSLRQGCCCNGICLFIRERLRERTELGSVCFIDVFILCV